MLRVQQPPIVGYHACEREIGEGIVNGTRELKPSENSFDWLGHGRYFWENDLPRAKDYGSELKKRGKLNDPIVIGAFINLGDCLDLLNFECLKVLKANYDGLAKTFKEADIALPTNAPAFPGDKDLLLRRLDCAVFRYMNLEMESNGTKIFDSIRGPFREGKELYPNSGFNVKNHIQICIRNPNCIHGFFFPKEENKEYPPV